MQVAASFHDGCGLRRNFRALTAGLEFDVKLKQYTAVDWLSSVDAETELGRDGMSEVRKWQIHGRFAAEVRCAAVMPPAECVGRHGPEGFLHQMLRPANVVCKCLAMDTRVIGMEVHEPQRRLVGYVHVCSLRYICLRLSRHAFALQRHWRHVVRRW